MLYFNICFIHGYKIARVSSHSLIRYWMSNMASDAKACFSSKVEYRAVIRYLYLKGKTGKEIHGELADVFGSSAQSYAQVKFWVGEFKRGRTSLEDEARSGCPLDANDEEMCKKVRHLVYSDRQIQVEERAQPLGISHGSISTILHDRLGMRKTVGSPNPLAMTKWQPEHQYAAPCWSVLGQKMIFFFWRLVTVDEIWVHYYEPENKAQSSVGRAWVPEAKEVQDANICWQGDGHSILGRKRCYYFGLFTKEKYINWSVLCKLVRPAENRHPWKTPR